MPDAPVHSETAVRKPPSDRAGFLRRLSIYLTGVAIGFLILGMFRARSAAEAQRRQAERAAFESGAAPNAQPAPSSDGKP